MSTNRTTTRYPSWPGRATSDEARLNDLRRKSVRIQELRDPLGAAGFRVTRPRIRREGAARRLAAFSAIASFVASFGLIVFNAPDGQSRNAAVAYPQTVTSNAQVTTGSSSVSNTSSIGASINSGRSESIAQAEPTAVPRASHTKTKSS